MASFEEFWAIYPRRVAKQAAMRMYKRALKIATPDAILQGAERYARERSDENPAFTKHPATWLNGGCWDDDPKVKHDKRDPTMAAFDDLIARAEGRAVESDPPMRDITPGRIAGR